MMKWGFMFVWTFLLIGSDLPANEERTIRATLSQLRAMPRASVNLQSIPPALRSQMLDHLRELHSSVALELLIRFRDARTIESVVSSYVESEGKSAHYKNIMASTGAPWLIPGLVQSLYVNREIHPRHWNTGAHSNRDFGISHTTAELLCSILAQSQEVPREVNDWARRAHTSHWSKVIDVRKWFEANKGALENGAYDELRVVIGKEKEPLVSPEVKSVSKPESAQVRSKRNVWEEVGSRWMGFLLGGVILITSIVVCGLLIWRREKSDIDV